MKKRIIGFLLAFFPLTVVNGYCLAANYFERGNSQVNMNLAVLFLVVSLLIGVSKLFFDFFLTVIASRCTGLVPDSGKTLDLLLRCMLPQWVFTLAGLVLIRLLFGGHTQAPDLFLFAAAHTVYYGCVAAGQIKATGKKVFGFVYGGVALVCWIYVIVNLVKLFGM